jgi:hypothetical protein
MDMTTDTYMVMKGNKIVGYIQAYSTYHALCQAEKLYGKNLLIERISHACPA